MKRTLLLALSAAILLSSIGTNTYAKGEYYRWTGDDGVIHYGARPPEGVEAELISTWGKSKAENTEQIGSNSKGTDDDAGKKQKEVAAARAAECEDEQNRIKALSTPGRRIRMEDANGTLRYLSIEEIQSELKRSQDFVNQACK